MTARTLRLLDLADALDDLRRRTKTQSAVADLDRLALQARRIARRMN